MISEPQFVPTLLVHVRPRFPGIERFAHGLAGSLNARESASGMVS